MIISRRRADIANSARNRSLSACISSNDCGRAPSSRLTVSRTARLWTRGTTATPMRQPPSRPMPTYMIDSIILLKFAKKGLRKPAQPSGSLQSRGRVERRGCTTQESSFRSGRADLNQSAQFPIFGRDFVKMDAGEQRERPLIRRLCGAEFFPNRMPPSVVSRSWSLSRLQKSLKTFHPIAFDASGTPVRWSVLYLPLNQVASRPRLNAFSEIG